MANLGRVVAASVAAITAITAITAIAFGTGCGRSNASPPVSPPPGKQWSLVFDAGFSGDQIDSSKLTPCFDWNAGDCTSSFNKGREHFMPSQVTVANGVARLSAEPLAPPYPDSACLDGVCTYRSGMLSTARPNPSEPYLYEFTYGYVETRLKLPRTPGLLTAFWMLPTDRDYKYGNEIDILENVSGKPDMVYQTYQYNDRRDAYKVNDIVQETNGACPKIDYTTDFHTYGVDWQPDHVAFFVDGLECGRFTATDASQIVDEPMQLILSLGVDTEWSRAAGLVLPSLDAADHVDVEYLRVWQAT